MSVSINKTLYIPELESIRGLMAWWVVFGHLYSYFSGGFGNTPYLAEKILAATAIPVNIFICLSGFVIGTSVKFGNNKSYLTYIIRRAFRIVPVYLAIFLIALFLFDLRLLARTEASWLKPEQANTFMAYYVAINDSYFHHIIACISLLQGIIPDQILPHSGDAFLPPAWSLSLEWQFYLLAPIIISIALRSLVSCFAILAFSTGLIIVITNMGLTFSYGAFLPLKLPFFLLGIVSSYLVFTNNEYLVFGRIQYFSFYPLVIFSQILTHENTATIFSTLLWSIGTFSVALGRHNSILRCLVFFVRVILNHNTLKVLGSISYPTYLLHVLVIDLTGLILIKGRFIINTEQYGSLLIACLAVLIMTFLLSFVLHKIIEKPCIVLGKQFAGRVKK